jgi:hypothetical protein
MYILCAYPLPNNPLVTKIAEKNRQMISMGWAKKYYDKVVLGITHSKDIASSFFTDRYASIMESAVKKSYPIKLKEASQFRMVEDINVFISPHGCSLAIRSKFFNSIVESSGFQSQRIEDNTFFLMLGRGKDRWTAEQIQSVTNEISDDTNRMHIHCTFTPNQWGLCIIDAANPDVVLTSVSLETTIPQLYVSLIMANLKPEDLAEEGAANEKPTKVRYLDV